MGRQKLLETRTVYSGTLYLDLFAQNTLNTPTVRLQRQFEDFTSYPGFTDLALWVQGAVRPMLLLLERENRRFSARGRMLLVAP